MAEAFQYKYNYNGADVMVAQYTATTGASFDAGDLLQFAAAGTIERAVAGSTRIAGVAVDTVVNAVAGTKAQVNVGAGSVYRVKFVPGTKTTFSGTDLGLLYDLSAGSAKTINPDDVTGGMCLVVDYNNTNLTVDVLLKARLIN